MKDYSTQRDLWIIMFYIMNIFNILIIKNILRNLTEKYLLCEYNFKRFMFRFLFCSSLVIRASLWTTLTNLQMNVPVILSIFVNILLKLGHFIWKLSVILHVHLFKFTGKKLLYFCDVNQLNPETRHNFLFFVFEKHFLTSYDISSHSHSNSMSNDQPFPEQVSPPKKKIYIYINKDK